MATCREIHADDVENVVDLLTRGFSQERSHWVAALQRLTDHSTPSGLPKYGYGLFDQGKVVGVVLLISTCVEIDGETHNRSNVSSWFVDPSYRGLGAILAIRVIKTENTTYFNVSPAPHTWTILERQGFVRFANGRIIATPAAGRLVAGARISKINALTASGPDLSIGEIALMRDHAGYGCCSLICEIEGKRHPFVFGLHLRYGFVPVAHLVYCRSVEDFVRFSGPIGRFLMRRGYAFVILDAVGPLAGLVGRYYGNRPRYRRGNDTGQVRLGDVAYSEQVMFGY